MQRPARHELHHRRKRREAHPQQLHDVGVAQAVVGQRLVFKVRRVAVERVDVVLLHRDGCAAPHAKVHPTRRTGRDLAQDVDFGDGDEGGLVDEAGGLGGVLGALQEADVVLEDGGDEAGLALGDVLLRFENDEDGDEENEEAAGEDGPAEPHDVDG